MTGPAAEKLFKFLFFIGILLAIITTIGIFLLILKVVLLFVPELNLMGMTIS